MDIDKDLLNKTPTGQEIIERIDKWDYVESKGFCIAKEIHNRVETAYNMGNDSFAS